MCTFKIKEEIEDNNNKKILVTLCPLLPLFPAGPEAPRVPYFVETHTDYIPYQIN